MFRVTGAENRTVIEVEQVTAYHLKKDFEIEINTLANFIERAAEKLALISRFTCKIREE